MTLRSELAVFFMCLTSIFSQISAKADDSNTPSSDMSALASLASSIGSNPQIMNFVSNLMNQKPTTVPQSEFGFLDSDQNSLLPDAPLLITPSDQSKNEPLKRVPRLKDEQDKDSSMSSGQSRASPIGDLMSLASNVIPMMNISNMMSLWGGTNKSLKTPNPIGQPSNSAQGVVNQVLNAYANGQIPNDLIQMALKGRIPPQIINLALSGQIPPQLIEMVITGQIPTSTIEVFLGSIQSPSDMSPNGSNFPRASVLFGSNSGIFTTTRTFFESLLGMKSQQRSNRDVTIPTLFGPVLIQKPSIRRFGQLVGEGISSMASLLPF